jgi:hypothetical protein
VALLVELAAAAATAAVATTADDADPDAGAADAADRKDKYQDEQACECVSEEREKLNECKTPGKKQKIHTRFMAGKWTQPPATDYIKQARLSRSVFVVVTVHSEYVTYHCSFCCFLFLLRRCYS